MNAETLGSIARKLVTTGEYRSLSADEVEALRQAAGLPEPEPVGEQAVPLWMLMQRNLLKYGTVLEKAAALDSNVHDVLMEASGAPLGGDDEITRFSHRVTKSRLAQAVTREVKGGAVFKRDQAALLAGLTDLKALSGLLATSLEDGSVFRDVLGDSTGAAMMLALGMLDEVAAARVGNALISDVREKTLRSILAFFSRRPDLMTDESLRVAFGGVLEPHSLREVAGLFPRAVAAGASLQPHVDTVLADMENRFGSDLSEEEAARIVVDWGTVEQVRSALNLTAQWNSPSALIALCWSGREDVLDLLRMEEQGGQDDEIQLHLRRLAVSTIQTGALLAPTEFPAGNAMSLVPALVELWMSLRHPERNDFVRMGLESADEDVRLTARCVQILNSGYDPDQMELLAVRILRAAGSDIAARLFVRALEAEGVAPPPSVTDARLMGDRWNPEEALDFYGRHQGYLQKRLADAERGIPTRSSFPPAIRAALVAGVVGGGELREHVECLYIHAGLAGASDAATMLFLALLGMGGCVTPLGRVLDQLLLGDTDIAKGDPGSNVLPLMLYSLAGQGEIARKAVIALAGARPLPEQLLQVHLLQGLHPDHADAVAEAIMLAPNPTRPSMRVARDLLAGTIHQVEDIPGRSMMVLSGSQKLRAAIARVMATQDPPPPDWAGIVALLLAGTGDAEGTFQSYRILARRLGDTPWVRDYLLLEARDGMRGEFAIRAIGELQDPSFVPALVDILAKRDPEMIKYDSITRETVEALRRTLEAHPEVPTIVYSAHSPEVVNLMFSMHEEVSFREDSRSEAIRLTMVGIQRRAKYEFAAQSAGKKLLLQPLMKDGIPMGVPERTLSRQQFEELAAYLKVLYVDGESGAIVAEVGPHDSGEIVNALFEGRWFVAFRAVWS
jgi:hypothetical protein